MKLQFLGAAGEVTGSAFLLSTDRASVLLDFGMHQGGSRGELRNRRPPRLPLHQVNAVVLSHAHIDHSGLLPLLPHYACRAPVWCTPATAELTAILLQDSANLQEQDAARWSRRRAQHGGPPVQPLYTVAEAQAELWQLRHLPYGRRQEVAPGVEVVLHDAGHILGSSIVELFVQDGGRAARVVFSGDLGSHGRPLLRDPETLSQADVLLLESTYGDRNHRSQDDTLAELAGCVRAVRASGGKLLIPAFAVGRTQELLYRLAQLSRDGTLGGMPVFVDSPMALATTDLYRQHRDLLDDEVQAMLARDESPLDFPSLRFCRTQQESMALNDLQGPAAILSASGMLTGGRILHHLKHHAGDGRAQIVIVGFQAEGTPGRALVDGARTLRVMGETLQVRAQVHTLNGFSAHADADELMRWARPFAASRPRVFLVHGEDHARTALAARLQSELSLQAVLPRLGDTFTV
jgi:metallo-beta-lactamase family protein